MARRALISRLISVAAIMTVMVPISLSGRSATPTSASGGVFAVGAAIGDFTPPPFGTPVDGRPDGANCIAGTPLAALYTGRRPFDFEEPYIDEKGDGHYDLGDPFVDCNHDGRWDGNLIGGGTNNPRYYTEVADPVTARAVAIANRDGRSLVIEVLDQEGVFDTYQERIRDLASRLLAAQGRSVGGIFISATHDESAPDSLGLGGVSSATSGTNEYFVDYMIDKGAQAIVDAVDAMQPASIRFAEAVEPPNLRQCWSSYPYVDDQLMPTMQAVANVDGHVIATLASVSQHAETLGFNGAPTGAADVGLDESQWLTADWPYWFRTQLQNTYGGVGIEMAGSVGSVETPEVFSSDVSRIPQHEQGASHPAGCATLFDAPAGDTAPEGTGYYSETKDLGTSLAEAVISGLNTSGTWSHTDTIWGARANICVPLDNVLFAAAAAAGVFAERAGFTADCSVEVPPTPTGSTAGTEVQSQVAAFRVGDGEFMSVPGEVFPYTFLGSFLGPDDLQYPQSPMTPTLVAHMHTPYRFVDGLAEDMLGYIFSAGNAVGIPGEHPLDNQFGTSDTDRFGCGHSDDSEATGAGTGDIVGAALVTLLDENGSGDPGRSSAPEDIETGRYVMAGGSLSRDPLGTPESLQCNGTNGTFTPQGPATGVYVVRGGAGGQGTFIAMTSGTSWMSLSGRPQAAPDRNTRGWIDVNGVRHWLDVFPDVTPPTTASATQ